MITELNGRKKRKTREREDLEKELIRIHAKDKEKRDENIVNKI